MDAFPVERVSSHNTHFEAFKKITSWNRFLTGDERVAMRRFGLYSICVVIALAYFSWLVDPIGHLMGVHKQDWPAMEVIGFDIVVAELASIPFIFLLLRSYSKEIQTLLRKRGISVSGWHWRGIEVDQHLLDQFFKYLQTKRVANEESLIKLMEAARDDLTAVSRPENLKYGYYAVVFAVVLAILVPVWQTFTDLVEHSDEKAFVTLATLALSVSYLIIILASMYFYDRISSRTPLESYLQSLHAIRLRLQDEPAPSQEQTEPKSERTKKSTVRLAPPLLIAGAIAVVGCLLRHYDKTSDE